MSRQKLIYPDLIASNRGKNTDQVWILSPTEAEDRRVLRAGVGGVISHLCLLISFPQGKLNFLLFFWQEVVLQVEARPPLKLGFYFIS